MAKAPDTQAQRRHNLKRIIADMGGSPSSLAKLLDLAGPSFISQMTGGSRGISDKMSRRIESATGKPVYWMDMDHSSDAPARKVSVDPSFVGGAAAAVAGIQQQLKVDIGPEKYAEIVNLVYEHAQKFGSVDADYALRLVKLTM